MTVGRAWACNVVRVLPGRGVQAYSLPADVQPRPEGMGLLMFTADPNRTATGAADEPGAVGQAASLSKLDGQAGSLSYDRG